MGEGTPVRQWVLAAAGVALLAAAGAIMVRGREPKSPEPAAPPVVPPLSVRSDGGKLQLEWDPQALSVRTAREGALIISDGARETRLALGERDLRAGAAAYWPESRDVTFRLELDGAPAGTIRAPAIAAEQRPSPFAERPRRKRGSPVQRIQAPVGPMSAAEPDKRGSRLGRAVGKIPLLRRLRKHRD